MNTLPALVPHTSNNALVVGAVTCAIADALAAADTALARVVDEVTAAVAASGSPVEDQWAPLTAAP